MRLQTYRGLIARVGDEKGGIFIIPKEGWVDSPFAQSFPAYTNVTVRYAINEKDIWPDTLEEVAADELSLLEGKAYSDYGARYSELTGYLWTDEKARVGGHDLIEVLNQNLGKYIWMEIE